MKPGETFKHPNGKTYKAVKGIACKGCAFANGGILNDDCWVAPFCGYKNYYGPIVFKELKPKKGKP